MIASGHLKRFAFSEAQTCRRPSLVIFVLTLACLLAAVHGLGYIAERLKQPRILREILAGILLGWRRRLMGNRFRFRPAPAR
jgi:predicted lysophospholipase L1 biosynthesis ABC-type transport system permease subunit